MAVAVLSLENASLRRALVTKVIFGVVLLSTAGGCATATVVGSTITNVFADAEGRVRGVERCTLVQHHLGRESWITQDQCHFEAAGKGPRG
jgi:hypothetical protein